MAKRDVTVAACVCICGIGAAGVELDPPGTKSGIIVCGIRSKFETSGNQLSDKLL